MRQPWRFWRFWRFRWSWRFQSWRLPPLNSTPLFRDPEKWTHLAPLHRHGPDTKSTLPQGHNAQNTYFLLCCPRMHTRTRVPETWTTQLPDNWRASYWFFNRWTPLKVSGLVPLRAPLATNTTFPNPHEQSAKMHASSPSTLGGPPTGAEIAKMCQTHRPYGIRICCRVKSWSRINPFCVKRLVQDKFFFQNHLLSVGRMRCFKNHKKWPKSCVKNWSNYVAQRIGPTWNTTSDRFLTQFLVFFGCFLQKSLVLQCFRQNIQCLRTPPEHCWDNQNTSRPQ